MTYSLEDNDAFSIDSINGDVTVTSILQYDVTSSYNLAVSASDGDSLATIVRLLIYLEDTNDHAPEITVHSRTPEGHLQVKESEDSTVFVGHVSVKDLDAGPNGEFTCSIDSQEFQLLQYPNIDSEFKIQSTVSLDREEQDTYSLLLTCEDKGETTQINEIVIVVDVTDVNDNDPTFEEALYSKSVAEDIPLGSEILVLTASDLDSGINSELRYSFVDKSSLFEIDSFSGSIRTLDHLDYETTKTHQLTISVHDSGSPPKSSSTLLMISVQNIDDEAPIFSKDSYTFYIHEEEPLTIVGSVNATDSDTSSSVLYSLDPRQNPGNSFTISPYSGVIQALRSLDREVKEIYSLLVLARSTSSQVSSVEVSVVLEDINDNSPLFHFPSPADGTIQISKKLTPGRYIFNSFSAGSTIALQNIWTYYIHLWIFLEILKQTFRNFKKIKCLMRSNVTNK